MQADTKHFSNTVIVNVKFPRFLYVLRYLKNLFNVLAVVFYVVIVSKKNNISKILNNYTYTHTHITFISYFSAFSVHRDTHRTFETLNE